MKPKNGDRVRIKTSEGEHEGMLMPRPEILEGDFLIIKLDSGYNMGISKEKIQKIDLISQFEQTQKEKRILKHKKDLPLISILSFGGTISSKVDYRTGGTYADYTAEDFIQMMPELESIANLRARKVMGIMSEDMTPDDWKAMAEAIATEINDPAVSGVVVTQGTDTLHFSSAALSFFLGDLGKPVVFTAAQRSIDRGSSDAFVNLLCAVHAAKSDIAGVMVCMHESTSDDFCSLIRGTKIRKMHTSRRNAFRPINEKPIARISLDGKITIQNKEHQKRSEKKCVLNAEFEKKTGLLFVHPGIDPSVLDHYIQKKYRGLVIAGTGLGHVPTYREEFSFLPKLKTLIESGCTVAIAAQTIYGRVHPYVYSPLRKLSMELGCLYAEDMTPETAFIKLGWVLGSKREEKDIKEMFSRSIAGEISKRSEMKEDKDAF